MDHSQNNNKTKRIIVQFRCTESEKQLLSDYAKTSGLNVTDFLKARTLNKAPRTRIANFDREVLIKLLSEFSKVASNVNQIARVMNTDRKTNYSVSIKENIIAETLDVLRNVSSLILLELEGRPNEEMDKQATSLQQ
ncbi:MAG: plasmid mobilization relaxosome protein MobC [Ferruginibacter sp.]